MEYYLLVARSITHAQQMARALEQAGIHTKLRRAGGDLTERGCGYTLSVGAAQYARARERLNAVGQYPAKVFFVSGSERREVGL